MMDDQPGAKTGDYVTTHCRRCAAGWTRLKTDGSPVTVCLLDREVVLTWLTDCDRFEPRAMPRS